MMYSIVIFAILWIAVYYSAWLIYKQKLGPDYKKLPFLRSFHEKLGFLWVVFLLINLGWNPSIFGYLVPSSILVIWTGINLSKNKPTAVFVHVGWVLLTTIIAIGALLKVAFNINLF